MIYDILVGFYIPSRRLCQERNLCLCYPISEPVPNSEGWWPTRALRDGVFPISKCLKPTRSLRGPLSVSPLCSQINRIRTRKFTQKQRPLIVPFIAFYPNPSNVFSLKDLSSGPLTRHCFWIVLLSLFCYDAPILIFFLKPCLQARKSVWCMRGVKVVRSGTLFGQARLASKD
jgi:hypothetical protein